MCAPRHKIITKLHIFYSLCNSDALMTESYTASWDTRKGPREGKTILLQPNRNVCTGILPSLSDSELAMPLIWNEKSIVIVQSLPPINWRISVKRGSELMVQKAQGLHFRNRLKPHITQVLPPPRLEKWSFRSRGTSEQRRRPVCLHSNHPVWSCCKLFSGKSSSRSALPCPDTTKRKEPVHLGCPSLWNVWTRLVSPL